MPSRDFMISQACLMAMHNECKYVQAHPESAAKMLYHRTAYGTFLSEAFAEKVRVESATGRIAMLAGSKWLHDESYLRFRRQSSGEIERSPAPIRAWFGDWIGGAAVCWMIYVLAVIF
jgi:hypothetical protein